MPEVIITLGDIAITFGLIGGLIFTVVGAGVAKDVDRRIGLSFSAIGIVMFGVSLWIA